MDERELYGVTLTTYIWACAIRLPCVICFNIDNIHYISKRFIPGKQKYRIGIVRRDGFRQNDASSEQRHDLRVETLTLTYMCPSFQPGARFEDALVLSYNVLVCYEVSASQQPK